MNLGLKDKSAVITGAGAGIGKGIALCLASEGARVAIADIDRARAEAVAREISGRHRADRAIAVPTDVSDEVSVRSMVSKCIESFGALHILVNNVGITKADYVEDISDADIEKTCAVNIRGYVLTTRAVVPHMKRQRYGRLIFISSGSGQKGSAALSLYSASKAFDIGFAKALGQELGPFGITSNVICPSDIYPDEEYVAGSWLEEKLVRISLEKTGARSLEELKQKRVAANPMRRACTVEDVAHYAAFLASDLAGFINCQTIGINGGAIPS